MNPQRNSFGIGPKVSLFTLGTMRANESIEQMYSVVKEACLAGINHVETAPAYGLAESLLGEAITMLDSEGISPFDKWVITSKILPGVSSKNGKRQLLAMLKRLRVSKIHNLAIHGLNIPEHLSWALNGEGSELLKWAKSQGLIGQIGFSSHGSFSLIEEAIDSKKFDFCSLHLHLLDQTRMPLAKIALKAGMGVMAISPADKGGHLHTPSQTLIKVCSPIEPLELAYRFLLSQGISTLTLGAYRPEDLSLARRLVNENKSLSQAEQTAINRVTKSLKDRLRETFCGQCTKCLPCPKAVPIPTILRLRNLAIGLDLKTFSKERYNLIGKAGHWWEKNDARACENCGECLPKCPNKLNIPKLLEETHIQLVDNPRRRLWG